MSLLILDIKGNNRADNYQTTKTTLENLGLSVTVNLFDTMADYNGTNPSPYGYNAIIITNYNKEFNNLKFKYDKINKNAQTILMNYLNNGGRLIFNTLTLSSKFNINLDTSWGELTKAIYSVNDGAPWSIDLDGDKDSNTAYLIKVGGFPDGPSNYSSQATIKQTNTSPILNNVLSEFTWNPSSLESDNGFYKFTNIGYIENLQTNNYVLNTTSELTAQQGNKFTYPLFLSNSYGKGQVLIANSTFGGYEAFNLKYYILVLEPNIGRIIYNFVSLSDNEICFAAGTKIETDQGLYNIEELIPNQHTINNEEIIAVPRTVPSELNYLICFEKDALGENIPNEKTILTHNHKIEYEGVLVEALNFLFGKFENKVHRVEYNDEILYNVLLKKYTTIKANNLIAETLHPDNIISKKYLNKNNDLEKV